MDRFTIDRAQLDDLKEIKYIEMASGLSPWPLSSYESELARSDAVLLIARDQTRDVVGFIAGRLPAGGDGQAAINNIGIKPANRRQGIGSMLIKTFLHACVSAGVSTIWLEVRATNRAAIDFYRAHGFVIDGTRPKFYSNPEEDAFLMSRQLGQASELTK